MNWEELKGEEALYFHAWVDMLTVAQAASVLREHDEAVAARRADPQLVDNVHIRDVITTGLMITYARPFSGSYGYGSGGKVDDSLVPPEHRALHEAILLRRHTIDAHSDATAAHGRIALRAADRTSSAGRRPPGISPAALRELAELAGKLVRVFDERKSAP